MAGPCSGDYNHRPANSPAPDTSSLLAARSTDRRPERDSWTADTPPVGNPERGRDRRCAPGPDYRGRTCVPAKITVLTQHNPDKTRTSPDENAYPQLNQSRCQRTVRVSPGDRPNHRAGFEPVQLPNILRHVYAQSTSCAPLFPAPPRDLPPECWRSSNPTLAFEPAFARSQERRINRTALVERVFLIES